MKITAIQPAVKTAGRYNVFVDGKYTFSLDETQLLEEKLTKGTEISEARLQELKGESDFGKKYARVLELILRRPRSEKEVYDYARRKQWEVEVADRVVARLREKQYIDDDAFAKFWVSSRVQSSKPISRRTIRQELIKKGVNGELIDKNLAQYSDVQEYEALVKLVEKKSAKYSDPQKFLQFLVSKGYSFADSKKAIGEKTTLL